MECYDKLEYLVNTRFTMTESMNIDLDGMWTEHELVGYMVCSNFYWLFSIHTFIVLINLTMKVFVFLISSNSNCVLSKHLLYARYRIFMPFFFLSIHNFAFSKSIHCFFFFFGNSHFPIYLVRYWIEMYFCYNFHHWEARGSTTRLEICILGAKRWCVYGGRIKVKREGSR